MKKEEDLNINNFLLSTTREEIAEILGVEFKILIYHLFKLPKKERYTEFEIPKRNGGIRKIIAPESKIKYIQRRLAKLLLEVYPEKNCVHGYVMNKSIKTNASIHVKKKILVNIDLSDFFPSINFGRVRGLFKAYPFNFNDTVATLLAQICCYDGELPQGAPTSPIVSNFICRRLDNQLLRLAKKGKFNYTRYADDITFSTNLKSLPKEIGEIYESKLILSKELTEIIESNDFRINLEKVRYAFQNNRQEVTGLIVNEFPNVKRKFVRNIRAMLHAWEKFGIELAALEHFEKYNYENKYNPLPALAFQSELVGKIGFIAQIRGKDDILYKKLYTRIKKLNPDVNLSIIQNASEKSDFPIIYGEGKTDWKHILTALEHFKSKGKYATLDVTFEKYIEGLQMNNTELLKVCEVLSKTNFHKSKIICLFDRDVKGINKKVCENGNLYKHWGNNVYSVLLPIPDHRNFEEICIEHYYTDEDLKTKDKKGRRIFLSTEFDKTTAKHKSEELTFVNKDILKANYPRVIDNNVFTDNGKNVALSKNSFAEYILKKNELFKQASFDKFECIFELLENVVNHKPT